MAGRSARTKGKRFEREVANAFKAVVPTAKRGLSQTRGGGAEEADVVVPHLHLECKRDETRSVYEMLEQAQRDAAAGKTPAVVLKRNRRPTLVVFDLPQFLAMFGRWLEALPPPPADPPSPSVSG